MPIPCPHFKITIVKRSQGQSAVAGAAYQSGERLFSEYDQKTKFYNKKKELVHAEVMLPSHAPPGYADRATLWNAVEAVENQWNSQLARRIVLALPVEVPKERYLSMIKEFCQEQFVSKGMIADFAIHDKGDGNPHAHILLTLRAMDEHGKWLPKARKVYDLDENGERIQLPSGNWKCHKENTVDWNDQKYAEVWRHSWETITNRYLEAAGRPERVDLRSFERQGIQQIPTVHLGPAAHQMEKRGIETFLGNLNRDIRATNSLILYHKTLNVGRVQTPTLTMLVNRDYAISSFKKEKYHVVRLDAGGVSALSERLNDEAAAQQMKAACEKSQAVCTSLKKEKKTVAPPKLFDLTALQREANRLYGFTAKQTLDYAQALYEKRLLTYPRTDSKYITSDMQDSTKELITGLCSLLPFMRDVKLQADLIRVCDNSKVTDHHAILPTAEFLKAGFASLADSETKLMTLVCAKLLCAAAAPYAYEAVTAVFTCGGYTFTAKGRTTLCEGWREIERLSRAASEEQDEDAEPEAVLPPLTEGQTFENTAAEISERYTQPPKAYTEDTLLSAMENAGKEETPEDAERKGLGTTATRAGIIEKLISAGFAERKGKKLIPTKDGYNLVAILPESLTSPQLTAEWETRLTGIAKGSDSPADFMRGIEEMTAGLVKTYSAISEDKAKLFTPQREAIGTCPRCGAAVYEGKKNYYCSDRACSFVMWKNDLFFQQRKKTFTKAIAAALLKDGKVKIKGMYSTKTGKTFDGVVLLADTGGKYVNFRVEQNRK